ncbi:30-kDa cleavage and polyadenylation specificity factor 30-like [Quillaja saponaria]|uniref:30-kDa cleavage and polyadenylation specificity factor 30-like n=1 Tax=Quillaja saponaria TaxID=32244 RepID=A0AAD7PG71_QUISA|nr:30-kDa cleavage and polyadenylation specificity factor 30-like [Quillaja saponaria]
MEDSEGGFNFDFEGGLEAAPANPAVSGPVIQSDSSSAANGGAPRTAAAVTSEPVAANIPGRRSFRQTVCRHWLRSLCMKGDACGFLHQYDKDRMPVCRFFRLYGECREQDCVYKHTNEDIKECNMYKLGFCPNGPDCRYRHAKSPGPPPPIAEVLQKNQHLYSYNYNAANKFFQPRGASFPQQVEKSQFPQGYNSVNQGVVGKPLTAESVNVQQQQDQQSQQQFSQTEMQNLPNGQPNQANKTAAPLPQGISRYFIVKSCNRENLELSVQQGDSSFPGLCKDDIQNWWVCWWGKLEYAHGTAHYGRNFSVKWLKLCELSFHKTRHLRNPYNENLPVKISRDCQELEPAIGEQLASLLYLEPDSELMAISIAVESKREEEKAKGVNPDNGGENPDIVPFEDNEEEEEEESEEEEEEIFVQSIGAATQGRGRGRGMMWPPHVPLGRGVRPLPGMQGFPPMMMGDGMSYGPVTPDGFAMPDLFGVGPRAFAPYGPRFSGDFTGPPAMMFHGRPSQPGVFPRGGFGMMMNPARAPFMGGMGNPARAGRPVGMSPMFPPPPPPSSQNINQVVKRDQRTPGNDLSDRYSAGSEQGKCQDLLSPGRGPGDNTQYKQGYKAHQEDPYANVNNFRNDESESEDEAPRRSRHGEGKKKR